MWEFRQGVTTDAKLRTLQYLEQRLSQEQLTLEYLISMSSPLTIYCERNIEILNGYIDSYKSNI